MSASAILLAIDDLRDRLARLESSKARALFAQDQAALPFGIATLDQHLTGGGLSCGGLHEVIAGGEGPLHGAAAALFAAGIAARTIGTVLWCRTRADLFAPSLAQVGLTADRVIQVEAGDEKTLLACFEEGLRHGGMGAVVGELARLTAATSRRLQAAAESSGTIGLILRRWQKKTHAVDSAPQTASFTRWRVAALPASALPGPDAARAQWYLELTHCRAGQPAAFQVQACDGRGCLGSFGPMEACTSTEEMTQPIETEACVPADCAPASQGKIGLPIQKEIARRFSAA